MGRCAGSARLQALLLLGAAACGCTSAPTTVLVHVQGAAGLGAPDELRLNVFTEKGAAVRDRRIPETGRPVLPGDLVLYPRETHGSIRVWVRALGAKGPLGDGATTASLLEGKQLEVTVLIAVATLPDRDGDGVPDAVDNCPDLANPQQGPCAPLDAGPRDGAPDRPGDASAERPEASTDLPPCDVDGDGHLAMSCGGDDCDDQNPLVHPKRHEGPPGDATCSDQLDNDCDSSTDLEDTECRSCTSDSECDDKSVCTNDSCTNGVCKSSPANNGAACDDGNACTTGSTCQAGSCAGGAPVSCPAAGSCKTSSCDPATGCVTANKSDGTSCDDGLYCTVNDACKAGSCTGGARDCQSGVSICNKGSCNEAQDRCDVAPVANGTVCDDQDACTQGESCQAGSCKAPALLDEPIAIGANMLNGLDRTIRVDSKGKLHVVFTTNTGGIPTGIRYYTNASGSWAGEDVASVGGTSSGYPSLVLDASDQPHVTFADQSKNKVLHARRATAGPGWTLLDVAFGRGPTSLAIDGNGTLHLAYLDAQLRYASKPVTSPSWQSYLVSSTIKNGAEAELSLALDSTGLPQIAFGDGGDSYGGRLRHATMGSTPTSWAVVEPQGLPADRAAYHPSLAITPAGVVQIAHFSVDLSPAVATLRLTKRVGGTWTTQIASSATGTPQYAGIFCALTLDSQGNAQIAHRDSLVDELRFVTNLGGSWKSTLLAKGGNVGRWASLARATTGTLHVLFEKEIGYEVRHIAFSACP